MDCVLDDVSEVQEKWRDARREGFAQQQCGTRLYTLSRCELVRVYVDVKGNILRQLKSHESEV